MKQFDLTIFILILFTCSILLTRSTDISSNLLKKKKKSNRTNKTKENTNSKQSAQKRINSLYLSDSQITYLLRKQEDENVNKIKDPEIYFQKVYSGNNPLQIINLSDTEFKKYIVSVYAQLIVLKTLPDPTGKPGETFDTAQVSKIYNKDFDDASKNKCCVNVKLINYQECSGDCTRTGIVGFEANTCLEIKLDNFTWRLCSDNTALMASLHFQIKTNVIALLNKNINFKELIENSFENNRALKKWDWHNQLNWGKVCENSAINLQSPIILDNPEDDSQGDNSDSGSGDDAESIPSLGVDYYFDSGETVITAFGIENIVGFHDYVGLLRLTVGDKVVVYQPNFIAFRFRSEHQIATKKFDGEIEVHFTEVNPDKKSWLTNGLVASIFLESVKETKSLLFLENLKLDFWKLELKDKKNSSYKPEKAFCLQSLFDEVFKQDPKYYIYKGSITTPPCTPNVLRLVFDKSIKIPEIQFKVLREQSLLEMREKEIHGRIIQKSLGRNVVKGSCSDVRYNKNLNNYLENNLSQETLAGIKATYATAKGDNVFAPAKRESLRDAVVKFNPNSSVDQLEKKLKDAQREESAKTSAAPKNDSGKEDCELNKK